MEENKNTQPLKYIPTDADYEKAEMDQLRNALKRTYTERFLVMTRLMKIGIMLRKAKITHTPYTLDK
jgi:hypothetical protein